MVKVRIANWSDAHQEKSILTAELAGADVVEAADDTEALGLRLAGTGKSERPLLHAAS